MKHFKYILVFILLLNCNRAFAQSNNQMEVAVNSKVKNDKTMYEGAGLFGSEDIKQLADEINAELDEEKSFIVEDLRILWQAAVGRSETIKFAIFKLSNPNGDKKKKSMVKRILAPIAGVAPIIGMNSSNAAAGSGALIGGGVLGSVLSDDSAINTKLSRVTDVDLVLLAQEIENLQQKLVTYYYDYLTAIKKLNMIDKLVQNRYKYLNAAVNSSKKDASVIAEVFYKEAVEMQFEARQNVLKTRAVLEQFVGGAPIVIIDKNIKKRFAKK